MSDATPQAKPTFDQLPLAESALTIEERARWINVLDPLLKFAGAPGDWGYQSRLGIITKHLHAIRAELVKEGGAA